VKSKRLKNKSQQTGLLFLERSDMSTPDFGERTLQDFQQWSKLGGVYYERNPENEKEIRTRYVRYDPIVGKYIIHLPTNWVTGEPTPEMKAWHEGISRAITTMQPATNRGFY
jgi:hypothetical protein